MIIIIGALVVVLVLLVVAFDALLDTLKRQKKTIDHLQTIRKYNEKTIERQKSSIENLQNYLDILEHD